MTPIWRRFQVRHDITFRQLHNTLQVVMGWWDYHLHLFHYGQLLITDDNTLAEWGEEGLRDDTTPLNKLLRYEGVSLTYEYDFGDSWVHELVLEAMLPEEATAVYTPLPGRGTRLSARRLWRRLGLRTVPHSHPRPQTQRA
ncbi:MAG: plasmid pRiA4b ORF-3 family protein [Chloroflexi bacterium]|nr:plasmid pRiA4b ORF-3 family protein [Chloroflexota bacterium]